ncbi:MAG: signal peptidase I [Synechococcales cyanobacterium]
MAADPQPLLSTETPPPPPPPAPKPESGKQALRENIVTIALALLLAFGLRTFVAEARWIPSDSMLPTLAEGDRLVVEKLSYRFGDPQRGDIVVFNPPAQLNFNGAYIKRLVGLPGDRIQVQPGVGLFINGVLVDEPYIQDAPAYTLQTLKDIGTSCGLPSPDGDPDAAIVVPANTYFLMGDNRNNSQDSHCWGFLPKDNIIGRTLFRWWPLNRLKHFGLVEYSELPK